MDVAPEEGGGASSGQAAQATQVEASGVSGSSSAGAKARGRDGGGGGGIGQTSPRHNGRDAGSGRSFVMGNSEAAAHHIDVRSTFELVRRLRPSCNWSIGRVRAGDWWFGGSRVGNQSSPAGAAVMPFGRPSPKAKPKPPNHPPRPFAPAAAGLHVLKLAHLKK